MVHCDPRVCVYIYVKFHSIDLWLLVWWESPYYLRACWRFCLGHYILNHASITTFLNNLFPIYVCSTIGDVRLDELYNLWCGIYIQIGVKSYCVNFTNSPAFEDHSNKQINYCVLFFWPGNHLPIFFFAFPLNERMIFTAIKGENKLCPFIRRHTNNQGCCLNQPLFFFTLNRCIRQQVHMVSTSPFLHTTSAASLNCKQE